MATPQHKLPPPPGGGGGGDWDVEGGTGTITVAGNGNGGEQVKAAISGPQNATQTFHLNSLGLGGCQFSSLLAGTYDVTVTAPATGVNTVDFPGIIVS